MFYARKLNKDTDKVEVWECEWESSEGMAKKHFIRKHANEEDMEPEHEEYSPAAAVCWAPGRTIGNIAVNSDELIGNFDAKAGTDAILSCQIIPCGKFRHGKARWYCKTHQVHWGTNADIAALPESNEIVCSNHNMSMSYVLNPFEIEFKDFEEIGIWCSLPPAMSSKDIEARSPKIHVHKRFTGKEKKVIDKDFDAIVCSYNGKMGLFLNDSITQIQVTPPAAFEFVRSLEENREMSCITCKRCGYPHLDLGDFAITPHRKHFCGNCGNDSVWGAKPIVSTPLKPLHDQFNNANEYILSVKSLNIDDYSPCDFNIWASTPAVMWTVNRPQEVGIHVHIIVDGKCVVDETFGTVIYKEKELDRIELLNKMIKNTIY